MDSKHLWLANLFCQVVKVDDIMKAAISHGSRLRHKYAGIVEIDRADIRSALHIRLCMCGCHVELHTLCGTLELCSHLGRKLEFPVVYQDVWEHLACDISARLGEGDSGMSVDECVQSMMDECSLRLDVRVSRDLLLSNFAHICPHVLSPSLPVVYLALLSGHMAEVIGASAAKRLRMLLVHEILQIPGPAVELDVTEL